MRANIYRFAIGLVVVALLAGAGFYWHKAKHTVSGRVMYNGAPLNRPGGTVVFVAPDGTQTPASIESDGAYRAVNVPPGLNRVAVYYPNPEVKNLKRRPARGEPPPQPCSAFLTPDRYAAVETSELEVRVNHDTVFDIDMSGPPIP